VNRGIVEAHRAGTLTSTSLMTNEPGWEDALALAHETPTLGIGVHLNLVQGRPLASVPTLTDPRTGELYSLHTLARRALTGRVDRRDVRTETEAQIAKIREAGVPITHLDSHRHSHALPGLWTPVVETALANGIDVIRRPQEPFARNARDVSASMKKFALTTALRVARRGPVRTTDWFVGISLQGGTHFLPRLMRVLDSLRPGTTELMVHVGHTDDELHALDPYTWPRVRELEALTSPEVRARLSRGDIELIHFGQL
jgi:chitin disaccharide deacetylase